MRISSFYPVVLPNLPSLPRKKALVEPCQTVGLYRPVLDVVCFSAKAATTRQKTKIQRRSQYPIKNGVIPLPEIEQQVKKENKSKLQGVFEYLEAHGDRVEYRKIGQAELLLGLRRLINKERKSRQNGIDSKPFAIFDFGSSKIKMVFVHPHMSPIVMKVKINSPSFKEGTLPFNSQTETEWSKALNFLIGFAEARGLDRTDPSSCQLVATQGFRQYFFTPNGKPPKVIADDLNRLKNFIQKFNINLISPFDEALLQRESILAGVLKGIAWRYYEKSARKRFNSDEEYHQAKQAAKDAEHQQVEEFRQKAITFDVGGGSTDCLLPTGIIGVDEHRIGNVLGLNFNIGHSVDVPLELNVKLAPEKIKQIVQQVEQQVKEQPPKKKIKGPPPSQDTRDPEQMVKHIIAQGLDRKTLKSRNKPFDNWMNRNLERTLARTLEHSLLENYPLLWHVPNHSLDWQFVKNYTKNAGIEHVVLGSEPEFREYVKKILQRDISAVDNSSFGRPNGQIQPLTRQELHDLFLSDEALQYYKIKETTNSYYEKLPAQLAIIDVLMEKLDIKKLYLGTEGGLKYSLLERLLTNNLPEYFTQADLGIT